MDYYLTEHFGHFGQLLKVDNSPQIPVDTCGRPRPTSSRPLSTRHHFEMHAHRPTQPEERGHRVVEPPFLRSSTSKLPALRVKPEASLRKKAPGCPTESKLHVANDTTTSPILQDRLDPKKFPELMWPWRWAYVPSNTTANPATRVLVPINHETQAIHPSYYDRFPSTVSGTPVSTTSGSPSRSLPIRSSMGQLRPISVGESAASTHPSDPMKVADLALESDEEDWEKVDCDDEWEVVNDPKAELEQKANEQSKV